MIFLSRGGFLSVWYYWYDPTARSYCNTLHLQRSTVVAPLLLAFGLWALLSCGEACCDIGMTCPEVYQKVTWFAPRTEYPAWSFPNELSFPSHMAPVFLMCKIDFKMTLLKLLRWIQAKQAPAIGRPQRWSFECGRLGAIFMMLSLCEWIGLKHTETWNTHHALTYILQEKCMCPVVWDSSRIYFKPKKKWKVPERQ